jgi:hypothetical protein
LKKARSRKELRSDVNLKIEEQYQRLLQECTGLKRAGRMPKTFRLTFADVDVVVISLGVETLSQLPFLTFYEKLKNTHENTRARA